MSLQLPPYDVPVVDVKTGKMTDSWYDFMRDITRLKTTDLADVSIDAPSNGEVLVFNSTDGVYEPGAN